MAPALAAVRLEGGDVSVGSHLEAFPGTTHSRNVPILFVFAEAFTHYETVSFPFESGGTKLPLVDSVVVSAVERHRLVHSVVTPSISPYHIPASQ